jgi:hypothetical protein
MMYVNRAAQNASIADRMYRGVSGVSGRKEAKRRKARARRAERLHQKAILRFSVEEK